MKRYISTYGDRVNDMPTASKCTFSPQGVGMAHNVICTDLRKHFQEIARKNSPEPREPRHVHAFLTTAIVRLLTLIVDFACLNMMALFFFCRRQDTHAMADILSTIRGRIVNENLQSAELVS
jgi:hypothetical protein